MSVVSAEGSKWNTLLNSNISKNLQRTVHAENVM